MLNHITVMGRLTRDPELKSTPNGKLVTTLTIACDRDFGEKQTDFIDCVCWNRTAEFAKTYLAKGRMAVIDGRLQIREWTDKDGNKRRAAEILASNVYFGDSKKTNNDFTSDVGNVEPLDVPSYEDDLPF